MTLNQFSLQDAGAKLFYQLLLSGCLILLYTVFRYFRTYLHARKQFPGPPIDSFWTGNLRETMSDAVHEKWLTWNRKYGHIYQTWNGPFSRVVYIGAPDIITRITMNNWPKSSAQYDGFRPLSGDALFVQTDHERWKIQRKRLAPAFRPQVIEEQYPCFVKHLTRLLDILDTAAKENSFVDLASLNILLTLDFIGDIAYGSQLDALSQGSNCRILQLFDTVLPEMMKCGLFPLRGKIPILRSTRAMYKGIAELRGMAQHAVTNARDVDRTSDSNQANVKGNKIFEILANQREKDGSYTFNSKELCDNYVAFLVAGGDPTAHTMSFFVYEVLSNPRILNHLQEEIDSKISPETIVPSPAEAQLPYLGMVLKETLRYSSTGFGTFRTCTKSTTVAGVDLPANTTFALWNPAVHRDPQLWENADVFDPERWRHGQEKQKGSYFPFSYGPRNCIGQGLAMFEMTLTLATLFHRYSISLEPGFNMEYLPGFTLRPKNGMRVRVSRRKQV